MPNRHTVQTSSDYDANGNRVYRYGFNGMESDFEAKNVTGGSYDFGARMYDPRIGRWMKTDNKSGLYPGYSDYSFSLNSPLQYNDPDGNIVRWKVERGYKKIIKAELKVLHGSKIYRKMMRKLRWTMAVTEIRGQHLGGNFEPGKESYIGGSMVGAYGIPGTKDTEFVGGEDEGDYDVVELESWAVKPQNVHRRKAIITYNLDALDNVNNKLNFILEELIHAGQYLYQNPRLKDANINTELTLGRINLEFEAKLIGNLIQYEAGFKPNNDENMYGMMLSEMYLMENWTGGSIPKDGYLNSAYFKAFKGIGYGGIQTTTDDGPEYFNDIIKDVESSKKAFETILKLNKKEKDSK